MGDQQQPQPTPLAEKWDRFYTAEGSAPFDSHLPSSQLVDYLCTCLPAELDKRHIAVTALDDSAIADLASQAPMCLPPQAEGAHTQQVLHVCEQCAAHKPPKAPQGGQVLELGCGTGASSRWMACQGFRVTAVDISAPALQAAAAASAADGLPADNPTWLLQDIFQLQEQHGVGPDSQDSSCNAAASHTSGYDFIYDCQVYHVLVRDQAQYKDRLPKLLHDLLNPGGFLMILAGNANEPEVGPNVMTAQQLLQPLLAAGVELVFLRQARFDSTEYYTNVLHKRPLAWWVVMQRPRGV